MFGRAGGGILVMTLLIKTMAPSDRMVWFDSNRVMAAIGVLLIHCTADFAGQPFPDATPDQRVVPVVVRMIAELSGAEMFVVFSLFLLAFKLDRRQQSFGQTVRDQAKRLLAPFVFWTVFYAFYRLLKAATFGYAPAVVAELGESSSWASHLLLGTAQYHLHFLPTLFLLVLFYPVMRIGARYPVVGLASFGLLGGMDYVQGYIWGAVDDPLWRDYLLRAVKILGYVGYGLAAFALYGIWRDGIPRGESKLLLRAALFLAVFALVLKLPYAGEAIATGSWPVREGWGFYSFALMPLFVLAAFMGAQYGTWPPLWSRLARYTFGVYLVHPMLIDLFDVAVFRLAIVPPPGATVVIRFLLVAPAAFGLAYLLSRVAPLAWTIGLGPVPWMRTGQPVPVPVRRTDN